MNRALLVAQKEALKGYRERKARSGWPIGYWPIPTGYSNDKGEAYMPPLSYFLGDRPGPRAVRSLYDAKFTPIRVDSPDSNAYMASVQRILDARGILRTM